jgi:hypothetical protein
VRTMLLVTVLHTLVAMSNSTCIGFWLESFICLEQCGGVFGRSSYSNEQVNVMFKFTCCS